MASGRNNVSRVVEAGMCTGCTACQGSCSHITFAMNEKGFPSPVIDADCVECGACLRRCSFDRGTQDDD